MDTDCGSSEVDMLLGQKLCIGSRHSRILTHGIKKNGSNSAREFRSHVVHVAAVQWGTECRVNVFSVQYEKGCQGIAQLSFDPVHR
jgi:hypothetical protein